MLGLLKCRHARSAALAGHEACYLAWHGQTAKAGRPSSAGHIAPHT
jgi:hypothetical protein